MSKKKIVVYKGIITILGQFHSGAGGSDATDHPLVRDTLGNVILRGESFAGLIRQELVRQFGFQCKDYKKPESKDKCECEVCALMGHSRILAEDEKGYMPHGSRLKITGGVFEQQNSRIRHGVAIERRFQVASGHKKYDLEALLDGARVSFELEAEDPSAEETKALERVLLEMEKGLLFLGGKKSAGFGNYRLSVEKYEFDLTAKEGVRCYLLGEFQNSGEPLAKKTHTLNQYVIEVLNNGERGQRLSVPFDLWFPELFLVNDPLEASLLGSDHVSLVDGEGNPWLPPSTVRGVFRSRAEQILRTLNRHAACDPSRDKGDKPLQFCADGIQAYKKLRKKPDGWPGIKELEDDNFVCLACQFFGNTFMAGRIRFVPGSYCQDNGHKNVLNHFLAVCRFSGGGKDGAKFDAWPLYDVRFKDCRIVIEDFKPWQIGLAALVLKDFYQWDMRMGFGTRKGYGQVKCDFPDDSTVLLSMPGATAFEAPMKTLKNGIYEDVKDWLEGCVDAFRKEAAAFGGVTYDRG